jgi:subtilisin family serine protease
MNKIVSSFFAIILVIGGLNAQFGPPQDWIQLDKTEDGFMGVSAKKSYSDLLVNKTSQPVIVAIIDSGIDIEHEDLEGNIWVNTKEIPDNGIDDDKNGYIDDVNGWNFIGGANGVNINHETLEVTRIYSKLNGRFANVEDPYNLSSKDKKDYALYLKVKEEVENKRASAQKNLDQVMETKDAYNAFLSALSMEIGDDKVLTQERLETIESEEREVSIGKQIMSDHFSRFPEAIDVDSFLMFVNEELQPDIDAQKVKLDYQYNPDFKSREIIGDNYSDSDERYYGNNDVEGPDALHGTHVAGIVGAVRGNDIGDDGIAQNVLLMSVRVVPDGDEHDKDVANGIRYAVDNGASIINMSFGKGYKWDKDAVDEAVRYAEKNDVLLVHAAGNSALNIDTEDNFPNDKYDKAKGFLFWKKKQAKNWLEVGALSFMPDKNMVASFSNYGTANVDIFAPGVQVFAPVPDNNYMKLQGTSMAAPVVAGVAAVLRSYFPTLKADQVKDIIMKSAVKLDTEVIKPGTKDEMVPFSKLSISGGVINLYKAIQYAEGVKGKKKIKKVTRGA